MPISLYDASVAVFQRQLRALDRMLDKAIENASGRGFSADQFLSGRLAPDMFALPRQIQIACDMAKGAGARLAGIEVPKHEDSETTMAELRARVGKVLAFLDGLDRAQIEGSANRDIVIPMRDRELRFKGAEYLTTWALPNFYFHLTTAYALLRLQGVPLGKQDFLGG